MSYPKLPTGISKYVNEFTYSVWTPNTDVMCCNVPWDSSYRNIIDFHSESEKDEYFNSIKDYSFSLHGCVYLKFNQPIRLNVPFSNASQCNYIVVKNPQQPVPTNTSTSRLPDKFYYFIKHCEYINPNCTELEIQLDVWVTYCNRVTFTNCFVARGHVGIANENLNFATYDKYLLEPEGLECGDELLCTDKIFIGLQTVSENGAPYVLLCSTTDLTADDYGTLSAPKLKTSVGCVTNGIPSGASLYLVKGSQFRQLMNYLSDYAWVSQGIIYSTLIPYYLVDVDEYDKKDVGGVTLYYNISGLTKSKTITIDNVNDWSHYLWNTRYSMLKKFNTYPYCSISISDNNGHVIKIRQEDVQVWTEDESGNAVRLPDGKIFFEIQGCLVPPSPVIIGYVRRYNLAGINHNIYFKYYDGEGVQRDGVVQQGEWLDNAIYMNNFPKIPVVNNTGITVAAGMANTVQAMRENAGWQQQRALLNRDLARDIANNDIDMIDVNKRYTVERADAINKANIENMQYNIGKAQTLTSTEMGATTLGGALGLTGSLIGKDKASGLGSVGSTVGSLMNEGARAGYYGADIKAASDRANKITSAGNTYTSGMAANRTRTANSTRDANYRNATAVAEGDYEAAIRAANAKVSDALLNPPSLTAQMGGSAFNVSHGLMGFTVNFKSLKGEYERKIGEYWFRYGYAINRFIYDIHIQCMTHFTYWKMTACNIRGNIPEEYKLAIRGIFEKGTTVWEVPDEIENIDPVINEPVKGIKY